ncbi:MAG: 50S ribosomal protein L27 [uncultured bacterium]|uniref:Large ribosomal subunit protein bL27 n=1 Tax=candidate division WWE3 bacterium TaxID=2053526 RepID=A0A656PM75_UNCKA|nr:50S ribosomal protein L27 [candidate division WWE3 bacterium RAAC2_WWE3_1]EKD95082.1 MAG: 50S ribosomal protein L27 [uncultured bacterium]KKS29851.1 MAG: 50S ribosomal protein L27 [candidate division WWE3 bacterium GW2011_GWB1_42_117]KKS55276.1 MAG: 50S ribosomal protein L27 [candidate division WWE3 bacterium GW2011_GWD2_42_34]KKT05829.1 MAG: 50S ribosomal protein L27 [candidate division WWE3 bacterium GW2011_GWE2_43_18]KKT07281.1 MAG: 50S ribosomal protein L27 [candidate division WWE3 bact
MAHKKAGGSKARQGGNVSGKRLGVKVFGGSSVKAGGIIIRQRGRTFAPGKNTDMAKDFSIFSKVNGIVKFSWLTKKKKKIEVVKSE